MIEMFEKNYQLTTHLSKAEIFVKLNSMLDEKHLSIFGMRVPYWYAHGIIQDSSFEIQRIGQLSGNKKVIVPWNYELQKFFSFIPKIKGSLHEHESNVKIDLVATPGYFATIIMIAVPALVYFVFAWYTIRSVLLSQYSFDVRPFFYLTVPPWFLNLFFMYQRHISVLEIQELLEATEIADTAT